jgi:hypothetical protein
MGSTDQHHYEVRLSGDDWWALHELARTGVAALAKRGGAFDGEYYRDIAFLTRLLVATADAKAIQQ